MKYNVSKTWNLITIIVEVIMMALSSCHASFIYRLLENECKWKSENINLNLKLDQSLLRIRHWRLWNFNCRQKVNSRFFNKATHITTQILISSNKTRFSLDFRRDVISDSVWCSWSWVSLFFHSRLMEQAGILFYAVLNSCFSNRTALQHTTKRASQKRNRMKIC